MAWRRRHDLGQTFRNDPQLQQFVLADVTPTGRLLGTGSYGSVQEVYYKHLVCAGKKLHETLIDLENQGVADVVRKYHLECQLMSSLRHPNITQFLGLCFLPETQLPLLVMERLETSLDDLLEHMPNLPLSLKRSVLEDVARGLLYLHDRRPPVIHRDLTSKNVLLTSSLVAKITDMGNSRIVTLGPGQTARTLSKLPGTAVYMPPEAQDDINHYGPSLDIFSFGHLALYTVTQKFPWNVLPATYPNPDNIQEVRGRTEVERRGVYIEKLTQLSANCPALVELVIQCLHNDPRERPSTEELLTRLQGMRGEVEGEYGGPVKLDMVRVRLAKEIKEKDRLIDEMEAQVAEIEDMRRNMQESTRQLMVRDREIEELQDQILAKDEHIAAKNEEIAAKDEEIAAQNELLTRKDREIATLRGCQEMTPGEARKDSLKLPLQLTWRRGPDMPFEMRGAVQSVVVQGKLYVGGGLAGSDNEYKIMEYDISAGTWTTLPPYRARYFAMVVTSNQLVLVGGSDGKVLGVWQTNNNDWVHPYPEMPTARLSCSAVAYNKWLVVAGGYSSGHILSCVEVLNTESKQWHTGPPTPVPWRYMWTAMVGDIGYFMGGNDNTGSAIKKVYSMCIPTLISLITSQASSGTDKQIWKEIPGPQPTWSTPISISGSLLSVGGRNEDDESVTAIHLYQPDAGVWVKIGDLPSPRYNFTCAMTADRELFVAGGVGKYWLKRVDIALIA